MQKTTQLSPVFKQRWSTRNFDGTPLSEQQKNTLMMAAQTAPSSYNGQPWFFIDAKDAATKEKFLSVLSPPNQTWAAQAGMLCFLLARRNFERNDNPNRHYAFDCGTAWGYLALQAQDMGLSAHAMSGFDEDAAYGVLGVDRDDYEVMAAIAVGCPTEDARENEERSKRNDLMSIWGNSLNKK